MDTKETRHTVHINWVSVLSRFSEKSTPDTHFIDLETNTGILARKHCLIVTVTIHINPLSPNIHKQILQTDLYTFL